MYWVELNHRVIVKANDSNGKVLKFNFKRNNKKLFWYVDEK
jgi:hypothetical protein